MGIGFRFDQQSFSFSYLGRFTGLKSFVRFFSKLFLDLSNMALKVSISYLKSLLDSFCCCSFSEIQVASERQSFPAIFLGSNQHR